MKKKIISITIAFALILNLTIPVIATNITGSTPKGADIKGQGYIAQNNADATDVLIDVTTPASFLWYADKYTHNTLTNNYDIKSGNYSITNNSDTLNLHVSVIGYDLTTGTSNNSVSRADVTLNLTGDLAEHGQNIFNGTPTYGMYPKLLASKNGVAANLGLRTWNFGFGGSYNKSTLPATPQKSNFTLKLEFTAAGIS